MWSKEVKGVIFNKRLFLLVLAILIFSVFLFSINALGSNECNVNDKKCDGTMRMICQNVNGVLKWTSVLPDCVNTIWGGCVNGECCLADGKSSGSDDLCCSGTRVNGKCAPSCINECDDSFVNIRCDPSNPSNWQKCSNWDSDPCSEWGGSYSCNAGQVCDNGVCKTKICNRDGLWGDGHEFRCRQDNTYEKCDIFGSKYEAVNSCKYVCSASLACNDLPPNTKFDSCNKFGANFLQDFCDSQCQFTDLNTCEDDFTGCTSDSQCDDKQPGSNGCDNQCNYQKCGNNVIDPGEQCELLNTDNNPYCLQTTTDCLNNKLGTRDAFGDCSNTCNCLKDPFSYSCVKGQCNAQCSSDSDCSDDSCSATFNDYCANKKLVDYNNNNIKDSVFVSDFANNYCLDSCSCTNNYASCVAPIPSIKCVKNICGAQCSSNADCNDYNPNTIDECADDCSCKYIPFSFCGNGIIDYGEECEFDNQCCDNSCQLICSPSKA